KYDDDLLDDLDGFRLRRRGDDGFRGFRLRRRNEYCSKIILIWMERSEEVEVVYCGEHGEFQWLTSEKGMSGLGNNV
ncbi:unnamed protein product, partial [Rotaria sp. Silwood1]